MKMNKEIKSGYKCGFCFKEFCDCCPCGQVIGTENCKCGIENDFDLLDK